MTTLKKKTLAKATPKTAAKATSKPAQKASKVEEKADIPEGLSADTKIVEVALADIKTADTRFQYRVDQDRFGDMVKSLEAEGQQVPIVLWGKKPPYIIVDGHRRTRAAAELKMASIKAIIRDDLSEAEAYRLAFLENERRKAFTKLDLAHALWVLINRRDMTQEEAGNELGLTTSKAGRLLKLLELPEKLQKAVRDKAITMHHACILSSHKSIKLDEMLALIKEKKLSGRQLARELGSGTKKKGRKKTYFKRVGEGFFLAPLRFNPETATESLRAELLEALKKAVERIESVESGTAKARK